LTEKRRMSIMSALIRKRFDGFSKVVMARHAREQGLEDGRMNKWAMSRMGWSTMGVCMMVVALLLASLPQMSEARIPPPAPAPIDLDGDPDDDYWLQPTPPGVAVLAPRSSGRPVESHEPGVQFCANCGVRGGASGSETPESDVASRFGQFRQGLPSFLEGLVVWIFKARGLLSP
jgi:hypothetical protein